MDERAYKNKGCQPLVTSKLNLKFEVTNNQVSFIYLKYANHVFS